MRSKRRNENKNRFPLRDSRHVFSLLAAAGLAAAAPNVAFAQSDEFDDEFEEREAVAAQPARPAALATDLAAEDDEFGGGGGNESTEETPPEAMQSSAPDTSGEGHAYDARGDLLSTNGSRAWRARRFTLGSTWNGATGGLHIVDAASGPSQSFRVQLLTDFFFANGFLNADDDNSHIGGSVSLSYTPFDFLEVYASIQSYANSNNSESPALFQVLGDSIIGLKGYYDILPWLSVGADVGVYLLNTVGDIGLVLDSTSFNFRANATADLRALEGVEFPLIARLNVGYYLDRSAELTNRVEQARYDALPTSGPDARRSFADEDRHLLSRVERFALNINRTDFLNIGIGVELPIVATTDVIIAPIVEWNVGVPVNSRGYSCLWIPETPGGSTPAPGQDGCLQFQGFSSFPSTLSLGVRAQPGIRGLNLTAAVDIGTSGTNTFVRELAGNAPYNVILGASYAVDTYPVPPQIVEREVEREVEVRIPPPVRGRIVGTVVEQGTTTAVSGAVVSLQGLDLTALSTAANGHFTTYDLEPSAVTFNITHPEYNPGTCSGTIPEEGGDVNVQCELVALPRMGNVNGHLIADSGQPVAGATVQLSGPRSVTIVTDPNGGFARQDLPPGTYTARVEADAYFIATSSFDIAARGTATPTVTVVARPRRSLVQLRDRELVIRRQVNFATDSADILPDSAGLLAEVADVLMRHPELSAIEIQGHTDNRGGAEHNLDLSQRRADAVREWLSSHGVSADRLTAHGYGDTRPVGPNITAGGRARNRRSQFIITSRTDAPTE
jgi:outer membrane protein OmpA-like peptidoglycan-associated protein